MVERVRGEDFPTPGQMYRKITVSGSELEGERAESLQKRKQHPYVQFVKRLSSMAPGMGKSVKEFSPEYKDAFGFLQWNVSPQEHSAATNLLMLLLIGIALVLAVVASLLFGSLLEGITGDDPLMNFALMVLPFAGAALGISFWFQRYPLEAAKKEQIKALTFVPEVLGYMIMSMKLVPNLEKAVEFAAEHGRGKIAEDLRELLWNVQIGTYNTLAEGLDALAVQWGQFSSEFKQALMMIRASVLEDSEANRYALLDKVMNEVLESIRVKMEGYARDLTQPAITLFYIGILLPLILVIILPVGSAFANVPLARMDVLILLYNILIPGMALVFALNIVKKRPPTYEPPKIPDNFPGLPKKWQARVGGASVDLRVLILVVLLAGVGASYYLHENGVGFGKTCLYETEDEDFCFLQDHTPKAVLESEGKIEQYFTLSSGVPGSLLQSRLDRGVQLELAKEEVKLEETKFFIEPRHDTSPTILLFGIMLSIALALFLYFHFSTIYKRKAQVRVMQMESEFREALYILASRMGENKPVEEALKHARDFLPSYIVSQELFDKTIRNIEVLGMPLEAAVFDPQVGSLRFNPSTTIRSSMRLLVDSVSLGVNVAARTLISLSLQLTNADNVNRTLKTLIFDVTTMMRLLAVFIGPLILGVTVGLQRVVMAVIGKSVSLQVASGGLELGGSFSQMNTSFSMTLEEFLKLVKPAEFQLIIALYVIEIVIIMMYFTTKIEEDNELTMRLNLARALPIAILCFMVAALISGTLVSGFAG
ncbi:MAG: hypothetical protein V1847_04380 [Candidatus Diapherotrites archaeon]